MVYLQYEPSDPRGKDKLSVSYVDHQTLQTVENPTTTAISGGGSRQVRNLYSAPERNLPTSSTWNVQPARWTLLGGDSHTPLRRVGMLAVGVGGLT